MTTNNESTTGTTTGSNETVINANVWTTKEGDTVKFSDLQTQRLQNCVSMVRNEIASGQTNKQTLLENLETELNTRTDRTDIAQTASA